MSNEENLRVALQHLIGLEEHNSFYKTYLSNHEIKTSTDLDLFFNAFKTHLDTLGKWNDDLELTLKIIKEQSEIVKHQKSNSPLFSINNSRKLNDSWLIEFRKEFQQCLTGDQFVEEIKPRRYKTITENLILYGVDGEKLSVVYSKYSEFNHPYVNYTVASVLYNAKNFSNGLPILKEGIKSIASYPNHYWNNEYGVEGAAWMIGDLLYLLGSSLDTRNLRNEKIKLLKLLFLYMSRYICMTQSNIKSIDFYSNRARIVKGNYMEFIGIFGLGVNPDIQYMSDMYLAYQISSNNNLTAIPSFRQFMWDSLKMYEHGSHIPNSSGGYKEIEDRTWMELVRDGEIRSLILGDKLLKEFESYELNLSNSTIDNIFKILDETKEDDLENYIKKISERKLNKTEKNENN
jgi:hypothetical protein